ncbi:MAG: CHASE2 and HATPase_c domain-containing protein, partial [Nitrospirota bacterium]|nr:CHASE2 and HATPase_c domain-containing protein [Nitrospirota bacterium]
MQNPNKKARYLLIMAAAMFAVFTGEYLGLFEGVNNYVHDFSFRARPPLESSGKVVIAAIDEKTLAKLGEWPLPRAHYAALLDRLEQADAVGFDIVMAEPTEDDAVLAEAISRHGRVILPVYIDSSLKRALPNQQLLPAGIGHVHVEQGIDGVVRNLFHTINFQGTPIPSLSSATYETATSGTPLQQENLTKQPDVIAQANSMRINYYGPPGTLPRISFSDIVDNVYSPSFFKGKIVMVGLTVAGIEDSLLTPLSQQRSRMPGVEIQATILSNLLNNDAVKGVAPWIKWLSGLAVSAFFFLLFMRTDEGTAVASWLAAILAITASVYVMLTRFNIWLGPALLYASITATYLMAYIFKLNEAALKLDAEYSSVFSQLRWAEETHDNRPVSKGLAGFLSAGGINRKIQPLTKLTDQLIFEKKLTDAALLNDIQGIALFNSMGDLLIANNRAQEIFDSMSTEITDFDTFARATAHFVIKDETPDGLLQALDKISGGAPCTLSLTTPQQLFLKVDTSSFSEGQYRLITMTDITKLKEMEALKGRIVSMVSHELKQPLTSIIGYADLLGLYLTGAEKKYAEIISSESNRMNRFIHSFLDLSKLESGAIEIVKMPVDLSEMIHYVANLISPAAAGKQINVFTDGATSDERVMLEPDLTKQCILNLLENAVKYSPPDTDI